MIGFRSLSLRLVTVLSTLALLFVAAPAPAQSVGEIVDRMTERYRSQMDAVDNYVVETDRSTIYYKKVTTDGTVRFKSETRSNGSGASLGSGQMGSAMPTSYDDLEQFQAFKEHAVLKGTETVNGRRCHVLHVQDPSKMYDSDTPEAQSMQQVKSITMYVDAEEYLPSRMYIESGAANGPSSITINMKDYRTVDGLTVAFTREVVMGGQQMSDAQRQQMEMMKERMKDMPPAQRKQMEEMMGMMSGEPTVITVKRVTVNEGIPDGIF